MADLLRRSPQCYLREDGETASRVPQCLGLPHRRQLAF